MARASATVSGCAAAQPGVNQRSTTVRAIDAVPPAERPHTLLMRKVAYEPAIETTDGNRSKVEVRILFIWKDGEPFPVTTLARLSQGKMMGVDFNREKTWVGSSIALHD